MNLNITFHDVKTTVAFDRYAADDKSVAIVLMEGKEIFTVATVYVGDFYGMSPYEVVIKDYSENTGIAKLLIDAGIIEEPHRGIKSGYVIMPVCLLTDEAIKFVEQQDQDK